jgi:hypothetical protein
MRSQSQDRVLRNPDLSVRGCTAAATRGTRVDGSLFFIAVAKRWNTIYATKMAEQTLPGICPAIADASAALAHSRTS